MSSGTTDHAYLEKAMTLSLQSGTPLGNGDLEITIRLTATEARSIGHDAVLLAEILDSCLWAMGMLRTGSNSRDSGSPAPVPGDWAAAVRGLDRLVPRLHGARNAAIRAYLSAGGTAQRLADALAISPADIEGVLTELMAQAPDGYERWAATSPPEARHTRIV